VVDAGILPVAINWDGATHRMHADHLGFGKAGSGWTQVLAEEKNVRLRLFLNIG
jgi:hypothetical protein